MPLISLTDRGTWKGRLLILGMYGLLSLGGVAMVYPFLIMLTGSVGNAFDYERRSVFPRYLWSREDRFMRTLCTYFPPLYRSSQRQLRSAFLGLPAEWQNWTQIADDSAASDRWAKAQLAELDDPVRKQQIETAAADYADFSRGWNLEESVLTFNPRHVGRFLQSRYGTLAKFNATWQVAADDFHEANTAEWSGEPFDQPSYLPQRDVRYLDLVAFREAYRDGVFAAHVSNAPAQYLRPAALRYLWEEFAGKSIEKSGLSGLNSATLPFPVGPTAPPALRTIWFEFLKEKFPLRHIEIDVNDRRVATFREFLEVRFHKVDYFNRITDSHAESWNDIHLVSSIPHGSLSGVWIDFVRLHVPVEEWRIKDTLPEKAFHKFVLQRHGGLDAVRSAYGVSLENIEQLRIPFREAFLVTFNDRQWSFTANQFVENYSTVLEFFWRQPRALANTLILVLASIILTLIVNPLAGYALSRFNLRGSEKIIIFCLATMAFPVAVSAIPGYLLLRDLGLLNTFYALVLPTAVNGMTIFLLKGFFDSLPKELYEAATLDGASEVRIFISIAMPLLKPILAVSMLNAFLQAYNGWEWAIVVCQDAKMWTLSVWTLQFHSIFASQPYIVMAAFVLVSIPVFVVFLFCQKIILRGIILPQMK